MEINKNLPASLQTGTQANAVNGSATVVQESSKTETANATISDTVTISKEAIELLASDSTFTPFNGGGNEPPIPPKPPKDEDKGSL